MCAGPGLLAEPAGGPPRAPQSRGPGGRGLAELSAGDRTAAVCDRGRVAGVGPPVPGRPPRSSDGRRGGLPQPDDRRRGGGARHPGDREDPQRTRHPRADVQRTAAPAGSPARHERRGAPAPCVHRGTAVAQAPALPVRGPEPRSQDGGQRPPPHGPVGQHHVLRPGAGIRRGPGDARQPGERAGSRPLHLPLCRRPAGRRHPARAFRRQPRHVQRRGAPPISSASCRCWTVSPQPTRDGRSAGSTSGSRRSAHRCCRLRASPVPRSRTGRFRSPVPVTGGATHRTSARSPTWLRHWTPSDGIPGSRQRRDRPPGRPCHSCAEPPGSARCWR